MAAQMAIGFSTAVDGRVPKIVENLPVIQPTSWRASPDLREGLRGRDQERYRCRRHEGQDLQLGLRRGQGRRPRSVRASPTAACNTTSPTSWSFQDPRADGRPYPLLHLGFGGSVRHHRRVVRRGRIDDPRGLRPHGDLGRHFAHASGQHLLRHLWGTPAGDHDRYRRRRRDSDQGPRCDARVPQPAGRQCRSLRAW